MRSLKPPKSHTPAIEDGRYKFGRASQILSATRNVLETYTGMQRDFLAQSHEARHWFAERAIFGTYEGIHHELRRDIRGLLEQGCSRSWQRPIRPRPSLASGSRFSSTATLRASTRDRMVTNRTTSCKVQTIS